MRVLRTTIYVDAYHKPITTVARDSDMTDSLESCRLKLQEGNPEILQISDIFDMPDGDIAEATMRAVERHQERAITEKHMAMLFHWLANMFPRGNDGAVIGMDKPAPMSAEDMRYVLGQLAGHPDYRRFTIVGVAEDRTVVRMVDGCLK